MKVKITRKDELTQVRECLGWDVDNGTLSLWARKSQYGNAYATYACTDWLDCEVVDD